MIYAGIKNIANKITKIYFKHKKVLKSITKIYSGENDIAKLMWQAAQPISNLPIGTLVKTPVNSPYQTRWGKEMVFRIVDVNHAEYSENTITLTTDKVIQVMCFDGAEPGNPLGNRSERGNNNFIISNIRQWLNSKAQQGGWYMPQHEYDAPPSYENYSGPGNYYDSWDGFLCLFHEKFLAYVMDTTFKVANPTVDPDTINNVNSFISKFALISYAEMGFGTLPGTIGEGIRLSYFNDKINRTAYPTLECVNNSNGYIDPTFGVNVGSAYFLRSSNRAAENNGYSVRCTTHQGVYNAISNANHGYIGIRPIFNVFNNALVTAFPDKQGIYSFVV